MAPVEDFHTDKVTSQMGMSLKQCDKQSMKMAILKQEATFRQQVHELHRLYQVQKQLMRNAKNTHDINLGQRNVGNENGSCQPCYSHKDERGPRRAIDLEQPAEEYIRNDEKAMAGYELESDLELTLATGCRRKKKEKRELASYTSDSSSSSVSGGSKLTVLRSRISSDQHRSFDLEKPQTPWFLPCLSLKMA